MEKEFRLMVAPLQGLTEAAWRSEHFRLFGDGQGDVEYFTPFIRVEKGEVRRRDLRDFTSVLEKRLCGEAQLRDKMKPYWEYASEGMDKKIVKIGRKKGGI